MRRLASRSPAANAGRLLGGTAFVLAVASAVVLLAPRPLADVFFAGWVLVAVGLALSGASAAWTGRTLVVWLAGLLLSAVSVVGMWSIGRYFASVAVLLLLAAAIDQWWGTDKPAGEPQTDSIADRPPLVGAVLVTVGGGLIYQGVFAWELFTRGCAAETLVCALAVTRWESVTVTLLGLGAVTLGGWLVWRQTVVSRTLSEPG